MMKTMHAPKARTHRSSRPSPRSVPLEGAFHLLKPDLQRAVSRAGYTTPTPIQEQCIPRQLEGRDILGCAQTGTGKTAAFVLPMLQRLLRHKKRPQRGTPRALVLAPTRELAAQIAESVATYGRFLNLNHTVVYGGVSQYHQVKALQRGVDVLVATPGRLLDLAEQGHIHLGEIEVFVLDEVDRMLDMGFVPDIKRVLAHLPVERQTAFFSATMPPKIMALANTMVHNPVRVSIEPENPAVDRIVQKVLYVGKRDKAKLLVSLLENPEVDRVIIFTQMKHAANKVVDKLSAAGIRGTAIHGNKSQAARTRSLEGFKQGRFRALVATDVAARGIDVDGVSHVINYDLPIEAETYVHRIGRTARAGAEGQAISFCSAEEKAYLREIESLLGVDVPPELEHAYHCDKALHSRMAAPKRGGGGGSQKSRRPKGNYARYRNRKRRAQRS